MERKKHEKQLKYTVLTALFAAMIYVITAFVKIPTLQGYIHIGDGLIFLAASLLPTPYAMAAGAVGAGMSDYLSGYALWVLPTVIIKAAMASVITSKKDTLINKRNLIAIIPAAAINIVGYFVASCILYGNIAAALSAVPTNFLQSLASALLWLVAGLSLDKSGFKKSLLP